jgi:hypothetical protein
MLIRRSETKQNKRTLDLTTDPCVILGLNALNEINKYRINEGCAALKWNWELYSIGLEHSINMGTMLVPFGHEGF